MRRLLSIPEAAAELGVPPGSLRTAAEKHGLVVRMGRAIRIDQHDFEELIRKCQGDPKERDFTIAAIKPTTLSGTETDSYLRARATAAKLKRRSRGTSPKKVDRRKGQ